MPPRRQQRGQAVIGVRPDDDVDARRAADDLGPLGLRDAAGDDDARLDPRRAARRLQPADVAVDLLGGLLADVAGVEDDDVGGVDARGGIALGLEQLADALAVVDVHLAAEGLDVVGRGHRATVPQAVPAVILPSAAGR